VAQTTQGGGLVLRARGAVLMLGQRIGLRNRQPGEAITAQNRLFSADRRLAQLGQQQKARTDVGCIHGRNDQPRAAIVRWPAGQDPQSPVGPGDLRRRAARESVASPRRRRHVRASRASPDRSARRSPWRCRRVSCSAASGSAAIAWATIAASAPSSVSAETALGDDRSRLAAALDEHLEDLARRAACQLALADQHDERRQRRRRQASVRRILLADPRDELAADPVRELLGVRRRRRLGGDRGLEEVAELAAEGEQCARARRSGRLALEALGARGRQLAIAAAGGVEHRRGRRDRHEVRLGEVAVVVRLLLGAQRGDRAARGGDRSAASPARPRPRREDRALALDLGATPRSRKRNEFMFFSSVLVPSCSLPTGRSETLASARSEPSSMFTSLTPRLRSVARSSFSHSRACSAERSSGSVTISTSGVPPRLKSTTDCSEPWMRPLAPTWISFAASSSRCTRWIAHPGQAPAAAQRLVVLGDLVALRQVGIEVVLAVKDRAFSELAAERQTDHQPEVDRPRVDHRQRTRQAEADRAGARVRRLAEGQLAAAEHLRRRAQLHVDLEADHRLQLYAHCLAPRCRRSRAPARARKRVEQPVLAERRAASWSPTGSRGRRPGGSASPLGIEIAGMPASDAGTVQKSLRYIASGSASLCPELERDTRRGRRDDEVNLARTPWRSPRRSSSAPAARGRNRRRSSRSRGRRCRASRGA
jgi:hypothetical protein